MRYAGKKNDISSDTKLLLMHFRKIMIGAQENEAESMAVCRIYVTRVPKECQHLLSDAKRRLQTIDKISIVFYYLSGYSNPPVCGATASKVVVKPTSTSQITPAPKPTPRQLPAPALRGPFLASAFEWYDRCMNADALYRTLLGICALVGLADSIIFGRNTLIKKEAEVTCGDGSCVRLSKTPYAHLLGPVPNWLLGCIYYPLVLAAAVIAQPGIVAVALLATVVAVVASGYLIWSLAVVLRARCRLCYLAHGMNAAITVLWLLIGIRGA